MSWVELSWAELSWAQLSWIELSWVELTWPELSRMLQVPAHSFLEYFRARYECQFLSGFYIFILCHHQRLLKSYTLSSAFSNDMITHHVLRPGTHAGERQSQICLSSLFWNRFHAQSNEAQKKRRIWRTIPTIATQVDAFSRTQMPSMHANIASGMSRSLPSPRFLYCMNVIRIPRTP